MRFVAATATLLATAATIQALRNAVSLPQALPLPPLPPLPESPGTQSDERISVLLPVRDEVHNISACLPSLLAQQNVTEILVLDDASSDGTAKIAESIAATDPRVRFHRGSTAEVPYGWIGKPWACERLARLATGDVLVFVDADVVLDPGATASAVRLMRELRLDMLCPYPKQLTTTTVTRFVQPLLQWSWMSFIPLKLSMDRQWSSMAVGNGQFAVFDAAAYAAVGGHSAVAGEVVEDVALARVLRRSGYRTAVVDGSRIATCRMYDSNSALVDGYTKSLWRAFGSEPAAIAAAGLLKLMYVLPPLLVLTSRDRVVRRWGLFGYSAGVVGRVIVARRTAQRVWPDALAHPLSILAFSALTALSVWRHRRGQLTWKGRPLPSPTA